MNSQNNNISDRLLKKLLGVIAEGPDLKVKLDEKAYTRDLVSEIQDCHNLDAILEALNEPGDKNGYTFKKDRWTKRKEDCQLIRLLLINITTEIQKTTSSDSLLNDPIESQLIKSTNCNALL